MPNELVAQNFQQGLSNQSQQNWGGLSQTGDYWWPQPVQYPVYVPYPVYPQVVVQQVVPWMKTAAEDIRDALKALETALDKLSDEKQVREDIKTAFKRITEKLK
jgi:hypothetical protein